MRETVLDITVVVPSYQRPEIFGRQYTVTYLEKSGIPFQVAVRENEADSYYKAMTDNGFGHCELMILPSDITNLVTTRDWISQTCRTDYLLMMDDDLCFAYREDFDTTKINTLPREDMFGLIHEMWKHCNRMTPMTSLHQKAFGQTAKTPTELNKRSMWTFMCYMPIMKNFKWSWGFADIEDFHMSCQLRTAGYDTVRVNQYLADDVVGPNATGTFKGKGVSSYRNDKNHEEAVKALAAKFPKYVTVRNKKTRFGTTKDITLRLGN